jgi:type I restriction enzyme S subunit
MASISHELRQAVLQAAIQGKLTEQLPEDGNARDLLTQIKAEKERLIKEKKIKKEKPLEPISEDEVPFDVPENWKWCYLGDIFNHNAGKALNARNTKGEKHKYITTSNVYWDHFELDNLKEMYYTPDEVEKYSVRKGDLLVLEGGDIGRTAIWDRDETYCVQNHVHRLRPYLKVDVKYFYYCMMYYKNNGMISGKGIAIQGLSANALHCINIPLPPLAEQHRIVARVEELMAKLDELEKVENELKALHQEFPGHMKAALLQAAMQGKLTKQLPEDGNARDLLAQIKAEKERLIKEKKIKKEKPLEPISEDEVPFDVPENWKWCYLGDIFNHNAGKALNARNTKGEKHKYITTSNVYWDHFELDNLKEMYYTPDEVEKYSVRKGDLLVLEGGDIGRTAIWDRDETYCVQNHVHRLRPYLKVDVKYFYYCMMYYKNNGMISGKGIAIQGLSANALHCINIPLPPLAEQHRIVERLDKLLPLCDTLQTEL